MPLGANKAAIMGTAGVSTGDVVLLSSQTASGAASLSFTGLMTSDYGEYIFKFYNINPVTDSMELHFQVNATDGADYNDSNITDTMVRAYNFEDDSDTSLAYQSGHDFAQSTSFVTLAFDIGNDGDESSSGELHIFNPASTTYVKHFYATFSVYGVSSGDPVLYHTLVGGYINDTTAIDDIQFKVSSGNFDGKIKMWGVK